jgi:anti-anti-sigma regulatory factor
MSDVHFTPQDGALGLQFEGGLLIENVASLKARLLDALSSLQAEQVVRLNLSAVSEVDSAGIQLLVATSSWLQSLHMHPVLQAGTACVEQMSRVVGAADDHHCCGFLRTPDTGARS